MLTITFAEYTILIKILGVRGKSCGTCDACWNPSVSNISYIKRSPHHHMSWKKNYDKITKQLDMEVIQ